MQLDERERSKLFDLDPGAIVEAQLPVDRDLLTLFEPRADDAFAIDRARRFDRTNFGL
jgi:hypothetical protein